MSLNLIKDSSHSLLDRPVMPKRWIVERTFGWLDKCRRLWKNCERLIETTLNMVKLAFISLLMKRF